MANYCMNWVEFYGETKPLKKLERKFKKYHQTKYFTEFGDYVLDRGKIGGYEKKYKKLIDQDDTRGLRADGTIDMSIPYKTYLKYGTKWWDFHAELQDVDVFVVSGCSAWSPPEQLIQEICKKYKISAQLDYEEMGMDFAGIIEYDENGIITSNKEYTYNEKRFLEDPSDWISNTIDDWRDDVESFKTEYKSEKWLPKRYYNEIINEINNLNK